MPSRKQIRKKIDRVCCFCGEDDYNLFDAHRIKPGAEGGKYTDINTLTACTNCHRKMHHDRIEVLGRHPSTAGKLVVHYIEDGEEKWTFG